MPDCYSPFDADGRSEVRRFLEAIVQADADVSPRLILADWLEEHDQPQEAELLRLHVSLLATCCAPDNHPERVQQQARVVELLAAGVRPCLPQRTVRLAEGVDMTFAWIPPGTFLMGSPPGEVQRSNDESQHRVTLTRGFHLGIHAARVPRQERAWPPLQLCRLPARPVPGLIRTLPSVRLLIADRQPCKV